MTNVIISNGLGNGLRNENVKCTPTVVHFSYNLQNLLREFLQHYYEYIY